MNENLQKLLKLHNKTVYRVSKDTGISYTTLNDWANGKTSLSPERMAVVADYFNVSVDELLGREKRENTEFEAKDDAERRVLMLCRKAGEVSKEERESIINQFEATIDIYLKAKGIKKE